MKLAQHRFERRGLYRIVAHLFGLTRFKAITFHEEHFTLDQKHRSVLINYTDVSRFTHGGWPFRNIHITKSNNSYRFRGLNNKDLHNLLQKYEDAEVHAWSLRLKKFEKEIILVSAWITDVEEFNYFQRTSVFTSRMSIARKIQRAIIGQIPNSISKEKLAKDLIKIRRFLKSSDGVRERCNAAYIPMEISRQKRLFDEVENNPLTDEQRKSVVVDEDANLVVAAAGSGKTSVIVAKAAWLIKKGLRKPDEILLLAFGKGAQKEMEERLSSKLGKDFGSQLTVNTFHSLGMKIISKVDGRKPSLSKFAENQNNELASFIRATIESRLNEDFFYGLMMKWFSEFFAPYESEFNFENQGQYWDYIRKNRIISLKGDQVKSFEECEIANFLFINGINYEYEADYKYDTRTEDKGQYRPDFYLTDFDIYIEHLGIKGFGRTAPFVDRRSYIQSAIWKRKLHKRYSTTLIETYSCEKAEGILTERLRDKLLAREVKFQPIAKNEIFEILNERKQIDHFTNLVITFLGHYKGSQLTEIDLNSRLEALVNADRHKAFIEVFLPIFESYEEELKLENKIDFHDMIAVATGMVESRRYDNLFGYIMVDEFQDISRGRSKLINALQKSNPDSQLFCVGDDWQAIYRFTGADINIMKKFEENFGASAHCTLSKTFRCEEKIAEHASHFVLQNDFQIPKNVDAIRKSSSDSVFISFRSGDERAQLVEILDRILDELPTGDHNDAKTVLFLGRYTTEILSSYAKFDYDRFIKDMNRDYENLDVRYKTMHGSKGLEADYVVILDRGFPSTKVDDPVLNLVLSEVELHPHAEERRLFYVALTRAKEKVFIASEEGKRSPFVSEIIMNPIQFDVLGKELSYVPSCAKCIEGKLVLREQHAFWSCSNYYRFECEHKEEACPFCRKGYPLKSNGGDLRCSRCEQEIVTCPEKGCDGFLQQRSSARTGNFWGCTNFFSVEKSCKYTRNNLYEAASVKEFDQKSPWLNVDDKFRSADRKHTHSRHGKPWSKSERARLRQLIQEGLSDAVISQNMGRSIKSIQFQRERLTERG